MRGQGGCESRNRTWPAAFDASRGTGSETEVRILMRSGDAAEATAVVQQHRLRRGALCAVPCVIRRNMCPVKPPANRIAIELSTVTLPRNAQWPTDMLRTHLA